MKERYLQLLVWLQNNVYCQRGSYLYGYRIMFIASEVGVEEHMARLSCFSHSLKTCLKRVCIGLVECQFMCTLAAIGNNLP